MASHRADSAGPHGSPPRGLATTRLVPMLEQSKTLALPARAYLRLHHRQLLTPVEAVAEPDESSAGGVGGALGLDMACLIQRQPLTQEEIFCHERGRGAQTEP
jgi:hypothetical protein